MKNVILGLFMSGIIFSAFAQKTEQLSEVVVVATDYKYLSDVGVYDAAIPVELLQRKVASYNIKNSDVYQDEYDYYEVSFHIPEGRILAAYDKDGKLLRTIEKFKGVKLPEEVRKSVMQRFPGWVISDDIFRVSYHNDGKVVKKYKLSLENGDKLIKVKIDDIGNFL